MEANHEGHVLTALVLVLLAIVVMLVASEMSHSQPRAPEISPAKKSAGLGNVGNELTVQVGSAPNDGALDGRN